MKNKCPMAGSPCNCNRACIAGDSGTPFIKDEPLRPIYDESGLLTGYTQGEPSPPRIVIPSERVSQ